MHVPNAAGTRCSLHVVPPSFHRCMRGRRCSGASALSAAPWRFAAQDGKKTPKHPTLEGGMVWAICEFRYWFFLCSSLFLGFVLFGVVCCSGVCAALCILCCALCGSQVVCVQFQIVCCVVIVPLCVLTVWVLWSSCVTSHLLHVAMIQWLRVRSCSCCSVCSASFVMCVCVCVCVVCCAPALCHLWWLGCHVLYQIVSISIASLLSHLSHSTSCRVVCCIILCTMCVCHLVRVCVCVCHACHECCVFLGYPLVNVYITMENHHFQWENPLFIWSCSIAFC